MSVISPFQPQRGSNQTVTTGAASASVSVNAVSKSMRLVNAGITNGCYVRWGSGAQIATTSDYFLLPNTDRVVSKADGDDTVAYLQDSGATTLRIQVGEGGL